MISLAIIWEPGEDLIYEKLLSKRINVFYTSNVGMKLFLIFVSNNVK